MRLLFCRPIPALRRWYYRSPAYLISFHPGVRVALSSRFRSMRLLDYEILEGDNLLLVGSGKAFLAQSRATISSYLRSGLTSLQRE